MESSVQWIDDLLRRYPLAFRGAQSIALDVEAGWARSVEDMLEVIENELKRGACAFQLFKIKQKCGMLRVQYQYGNEKIREAVNAAEKICSEICEVCGREGAVGQLRSGGIGCRCVTHR